MSKSVLPIRITENHSDAETIAFVGRTIEVPCRLPEAFNFKFIAKQYTAVLSGSGADLHVEQVDWTGGEPSEEEFNEAGATAEAILDTAKDALGITDPVPPGSPLQSIALAYEAEVAAYDAAVKALQSLPRTLQNPSHVPTHPSERQTYVAGAVAMLAKYVEYVFEQAVKAHEVKS